VKEVTEIPEGVVFSSGSAVRRPPRITLLKLKFAIVFSLSSSPKGQVTYALAFFSS